MAEEMWNKIFNHPEVQKIDKLKDFLSSDFNYESIYQKVVFGAEFSNDEKAAIKAAIFNAYKELDDKILEFSNNLRTDQRLNDLLNNLNKYLIDFAAPTPNQKTYRVLFTLNQDLFIERYIKVNYICPGLNQLPAYGSSNDKSSRFSSKFNVIIPDSADSANIELDSANINYIKLHGSFNWINSLGDDAMIIGLDKNTMIANKPLINRYHEIFQEALCQGDCNLLVIGYGFADHHINKVITDAVLDYGLKLHIISNEKADDLVSRIEGIGIKHLSGYHQNALRDIDLNTIK